MEKNKIRPVPVQTLQQFSWTSHTMKVHFLNICVEYETTEQFKVHV